MCGNTWKKLLEKSYEVDSMLENKEIKTEDLIRAYETLERENIELKARCRNLSHRNLILETENTDLKFSQKMFWIKEDVRI